MRPILHPEPQAGDDRHPSVRRRLLVLLLIPMLVTVLAASTIAHVVVLGYLNDVHDRDLSEEVQGLGKMLQDARSNGALTAQAISLIEEDTADGRNFFSIRSARRGLVSGSALSFPSGPMPSSPTTPLLYDAQVAGTPVRAVSVTIPSPVDPTDQLVLTLAETLADREQGAREILMMIVPLQLLLTAVLLVLVWHGVRFGLRILDPLTQRLALSGHSLAPISAADVPIEILPLTRTIDTLFGRLRELIELQERFVADAAHQLRTPLAGLALHAERAIVSTSGEERNASLAYIRELTLRVARTSSQLLSLTRVQARIAEPSHLVPIDLARLLPEVLGLHVQQAANAGVDLGYEGMVAPAFVGGDAAALQELVDNLVDNAMAYAGKDGTVTVGLRLAEDGRSICISIDDDGPGVPEALVQRLGERFFRLPGAVAGGTGLGLAIVQRIADWHHAHVVYRASTLGGLRVEIHFPPPVEGP